MVELEEMDLVCYRFIEVSNHCLRVLILLLVCRVRSTVHNDELVLGVVQLIATHLLKLLLLKGAFHHIVAVLAELVRQDL